MFGKYRIRANLGFLAILLVGGSLVILGYKFGQNNAEINHQVNSDHKTRSFRFEFDGDLGYEDMVGTWVLTEDSRRKLSKLVVSKSNRDAVSSDLSPIVNEFTLMMVLTGRHFSLYRSDYLVGSMGAFPRASDDFKMTQSPFGTETFWREDGLKEQLLDSRVVGHGLDLTTGAIVWALKKPVTRERATLSSVGDENHVGTLVIKKETNPDMWGEYYFFICVEEHGLIVRQDLTNSGFKGHFLAWRRIE